MEFHPQHAFKKAGNCSVQIVDAIESIRVIYNNATEIATNSLLLKFIHKSYYITISFSISTNPPSCKNTNLDRK